MRAFGVIAFAILTGVFVSLGWYAVAGIFFFGALDFLIKLNIDYFKHNAPENKKVLLSVKKVE